MLAVSSHLYYVRYPPGFEEYLTQPTDGEQFDTNAFLLRVDKNCYSAAGVVRMGYGTLAGFLQETLELKTSQIEQCVFVRHTYTWGQRTADVHDPRIRRRPAYVRLDFDSGRDLGRTLLLFPTHGRRIGLPRHRVQDLERQRPSTSGSIRRQGGRGAETGFGGCRAVTTPPTTDYTAILHRLIAIL